MKEKTARIIFFATLLVLICEVILINLSLSVGGHEITTFDRFYPGNCPNTLWTSEERDMYLVSDENGETPGAVKIGKEINFFRMRFYMRANAIGILTLDDIAHPYLDGCNHCFYGKLSCSEDGCILTYDAADDKEQYFGKREGEVSVTFTKSDLPAPFSFDSEESLAELPFR